MIEPFAVSGHREAGSLVLHLVGDVDANAFDPLLGAYAKGTVGTSADEVVLDFTRVGYINSSGIAMIVSLLGRARADHRRVAAYGLSDHYRQIFEITRLSDFIDIRDRPEEGAAEPRPHPS